MARINEGDQVIVAGLDPYYDLGAVSHVAMHGRYTMAGQILVTTTDPKQPPGFARLIETKWYAPHLVTTKEA